MIGTKNMPPKVAPTRSHRSLVDTCDEWPAISNLPEHLAEQVKLERRLEITPSSVWIPGYPEEGIQARHISALDRLSKIKAKNPTESMLAVQLVNTYEAYVHCHRLAMINANNVALFSSHIKNAERLSVLYMRQLSALDKHRGRGKQQVRVEHVHVAAGAQAVVGHLEVNGETSRSLVQQNCDLATN